MPRFFIAASNIFGGIAYINGRDAEHIKVLRIRRGESFTVCDGEGTDYICRLKGGGEDGFEAEIIEKHPSAGEAGVSCAVYAAFSKGERMDYTVQKCVELGASEIVIFPSARCIAVPDGLAAAKKLSRWQRIAEEAAKQSGRGRIPTVTAAQSFDKAVADAAKAELSLFLYEDEKKLGLKAAIESSGEPKSVSIMTGPEGGFEPSEAEKAAAAGMKTVTLGARILRCETAPGAALAAVMYALGELG